jgi:endonuclease G
MYCDRGHMAAAANHRSNQKNMDETFYLCNIAPQVPLEKY